MRISSLQLEQFRSYPALSIDLSTADVHVFVGANGAGKTNILEAISVLSLTKSCHGSDEADVMQWETEYYRVRAKTETSDSEEKQLEVVSQTAPRKKKACFINDVQVAAGEMVGALPTVFFLPQDLDLFTGAPQQRRTFLDQLLCQVSPEYLVTLATYQKTVKQRNGLLKSIREGYAKEADLEIWDQTLAQHGAKITLKRLELIEVLQCTLREELHALGEAWETVELVYDRKGWGRDLAGIENDITSLLAENRKRDIILQSTSAGPHREDWHMEADGRSLPTFASRGQQRTAVLALLFLQVSFLELRRNEKPVILLDDVFSELDDAHQVALLKSLEGHQVVITTTHIPSEVHGAQIWEVKAGECAPVQTAVAA